MKIFLYVLIPLFVLTACSGSRDPKPLALPEPSVVYEVSVEQGDTRAVCHDQDWIAEFMTALSGIGESVSDSTGEKPDIEDFVKVDITSNMGEITTVYYYTRNGVEYIEQPQRGIFVAEHGIGTNIRALLENEDAQETEATLSYFDLFGTNTPALILNGELYYCTGEDSEEEHPAVFDGIISSSVEGNDVPKEEEQSNFGSGYVYVRNDDGTVDVQMAKDKWVIFRTDGVKVPKPDSEGENKEDQSDANEEPATENGEGTVPEADETEPLAESEPQETQPPTPEVIEIVRETTAAETAVSVPEPSRDIRKMEDIFMMATDSSDGAVTVKVANNSDRTVYVMDGFYIERLDNDGTWKGIDKVSAVDPGEGRLELAAGESCEIAVDYVSIYGLLAPGDYRVVKMLRDYSDDGSYDEYGYWALFSVS